MILTGIISYPLSWLLDRVSLKKQEYGIFSNNQLGALIKHHERAEKHGGNLGQDATRIMLGALSMDAHRIGGQIGRLLDPSCSDIEKDVEKADLAVVQGMIVKWHAVQTVNINDPVDKAFIKKIKSWSYSRIPVIGDSLNGKEKENQRLSGQWEGTKIFGFLHIKVRLYLFLFVIRAVLNDALEPRWVRHQERP